MKNDFESSKQQIRCLISNVYDMQKLRISAGNRIVTSFYIKMGINPSEKIDNAEKDEKKMIDRLKKDYKRITDGVVKNSETIKKTIKDLNASDTILDIIKDETDYKLMKSYMLLLESEEDSVKVLEKFVKAHPMYTAFFDGVKGCGTLMSAVCIAYLDPYKARHVSCFFRYCGLDTVQDTDKQGRKLFTTQDGTSRKVFIKDMDVETGNCIYEDETGKEYIGDVLVSEHGRRMGDTEMQDYVDKDGNIKQKRGLTYNPIVKTKLMGVLTGCIMKAKDPTYSTIYYDYRKRLDGSVKTKDYTDGHKNMMAQRYMIKQFLRNMWTTWRVIEGLPVDNPYEVEKLGHTPHKYNAYQCEQAKKVI